MPSLLSAVADLARPLAAATALGGTAWGLGALARRALRKEISSDEHLGRAGVDMALGFALLAALGFWLGIAGGLTLWGLVGGVLLMAGVFRWFGRRRARGALGDAPPPARGGGWRWSGMAVAASIVVPLAALALYPPTGFDATMYHLPFAKAFVATGALPFLPDLRFPVFPQGSEVLFAEAMLLDGDRAAQLVSLLATLATAAILFGWARRVALAGAPAEGTGALAAALFLGGPVVAYLSASGYCEPVLVLFCTAAFDQIDRGANEDSRSGLAGLFAGSAAGVKYFGLFPVGVVLAVALCAPATSRGERWRRFGWSLGGVALFALPWYVRNAVYTGNPVIPLFPQLFGPSPWGGPAALAPWSQGHGWAQLGAMLRLPWTLTFDRPEFGRMPPWSPVLMIALVAVSLALRNDRRARLLLGASLLYLAAFFFLPLDGRYLLPILPLLVIAGARAVAPHLVRHRFLLPAVVLLALAPTGAWSLYQLHRLGPLPLTPATRGEFLGARFKAYGALRFLARTRGAAASVYGLYAENHAYYAPGRFQGDWEGRAPFREILKSTTSGDALADELARREVTHLLTRVENEPQLPRDPSFKRRFHLVYDDGKARVWELLEGDG